MSKKVPKPLSELDKKWIKIFASILIPVFLFLCYKISFAPKTIVPVGYLCLFAGLLTEYSRTVTWEKFFHTLLGAFAISLGIFITALGDTRIEALYQGWATMFFVMVLFLVVILNFDRLLPQINEGVVLFQTIVFLYWVTNQHNVSTDWFTVGFAIVSVFCIIYTLYHTFALDKHTTTTKLTLSVWSCIIISTLGLDNFFQINEQLPVIEKMPIGSAVLTSIQLFLSGISILYVFGSFMMIFSLFPTSDKNMTEKEFKQAKKELKQLHEKRINDQQTRSYHIIIMVAFTGLVFGVNYFYQLLPPNFVIWCVFVTFPVLMFWFQKLLPPIGYTADGDKIESDFFQNYRRFK